jgi:hypothetical protein
MVAASGVAAAKQIPLRQPPPSGLPPRFQASGLGDLPRLFCRESESAADRLARLSSAALVYSVDKEDTVQPAKILRGREKQVLEDLDAKRRGCFETDRSCPHCRLLYRTLYENETIPPVAVVNHSARVNISFDPESLISDASIKNFQVLVPEQIARKLIRLSHPLNWAEPKGALFQRAEAVDANGTRGRYRRESRATIEQIWNDRAASNAAFIFEDVVWPVNETLTANSENIIRFESLNGDAHSLRYEYSLERSVRSNFGVAWEPAGLDLDGGVYEARIIRLADINHEAIERNEMPLKDRKERDLLEMAAMYDDSGDRMLFTNWHGMGPPLPDPSSERADCGGIAAAVKALASQLERNWAERLGPYCLMDISASKELHFTAPENGPIELWEMLTWTAPAILFTFLNQAICHAPHLLVDELVKS